MKEDDIKLLIKALAPVIREYVEKELSPLTDRITALELHFKAAMKWEDNFQHGRVYPQGSVVRHAHAQWIAKTDTDRMPGTQDSGWRLITKSH